MTDALTHLTSALARIGELGAADAPIRQMEKLPPDDAVGGRYNLDPARFAPRRGIQRP